MGDGVEASVTVYSVQLTKPEYFRAGILRLFRFSSSSQTLSLGYIKGFVDKSRSYPMVHTADKSRSHFIQARTGHILYRREQVTYYTGENRSHIIQERTGHILYRREQII